MHTIICNEFIKDCTHNINQYSNNVYRTSTISKYKEDAHHSYCTKGTKPLHCTTYYKGMQATYRCPLALLLQRFILQGYRNYDLYRPTQFPFHMQQLLSIYTIGFVPNVRAERGAHNHLVMVL
jgi:hypothetical protein